MEKVDEFNDIKGLTITLDDGTELEFLEVATISINDINYLIMQPKESSDVISSEEAIVCKVIETENDFEYEIVTDDVIIDEVFSKYNELFSEDEE